MNKSVLSRKPSIWDLVNTSSGKSASLLLAVLLLWGSVANAQTTYRWTSTSGTSFITASNWTPARIAPNVTDILEFNNITTAPIIVDLGSGNDPTSQVISQLRIVNNANVTLSGPTTAADGAVLSISNAPIATNADFLVDATSRLTLSGGGNTLNRFLVLSIGSGKKGLVDGTLIYDSPTTDRVVPMGTGTLTFSATGSCTVTSNFGPPFGTTGGTTLLRPNGTPSTDSDVAGVGSVTFQSGSSFTQAAGNSPFGPGPSPVALFNSGSTYTYNAGNFSSVGRTYGNLVFNNSTTVSGTEQMLVRNDLTVTAGTVTLNLTGTGTASTAPISLGGNLNINGTLNFTPTSTSTVAFNGPISPATTAIKRQIDGNGTLNFSSFIIFEINNPAGLGLNLPVTANGGLRFTQGLISTFDPLNLPATASISGNPRSSDANGVGGSFVDGPVARLTTGAVNNLVFPVGRPNANGIQKNYRPMLLTTNQNNTVTYKGEQKETPPDQTPLTPPLKRVSFRRYFNLAPNLVPTSATGITFSAKVTLTFDVDDFVNYPGDATFVIAKNDAVGGAWTNAGHSAETGTANGGRPVAGTLTSNSLVTNFAPYIGATASGSNFSLASTSTIAPFPGINPLPVQLTRFEARAQNSSVALDWATASEKNSERFEIERSADGTSFQAVGTVKGQGTSSSAHEYTFVDAKPLAGQAYYRLRQVDTDGTAAYSPVATVRRNAELAIYPNPTTDFVTLPAGLGAVSYRVFNSLGQTLTSGQATGGDRLDLSTLPKGAFFLELTDTAGRHTQRLMRQ